MESEVRNDPCCGGKGALAEPVANVGTAKSPAAVIPKGDAINSAALGERSVGVSGTSWEAMSILGELANSPNRGDLEGLGAATTDSTIPSKRSRKGNGLGGTLRKGLLSRLSGVAARVVLSWSVCAPASSTLLVAVTGVARLFRSCLGNRGTGGRVLFTLKGGRTLAADGMVGLLAAAGIFRQSMLGGILSQRVCLAIGVSMTGDSCACSFHQLGEGL